MDGRAHGSALYSKTLAHKTTMNEKLRFTGDWPPLDILRQYPNWEYAIDEEDVEGQDETTIRPESQQNAITNATAFTAARSRQADGTERMAIMAIIAGRIESIDVFTNDRDAWRVIWNGDEWEPFIQDWLPEDERMPYVFLSENAIFPMHVETLLPLAETGYPLIAEVP